MVESDAILADKWVCFNDYSELFHIMINGQLSIVTKIDS